MRPYKAVVLAAALMAAGCSIKQEALSVRIATGSEICVIEDPAVRPTFTYAYVRILRERGFTVRRLEPGSSVTACPLTTTYTARWSHDFTIYMALAKLTVFRDGVEVGEATYDAKGGGLRMDKWIDAEEKLREMVEQLFPG